MMTGKHLGYIRVSSLDQNSERQLDGMTLDKTFTDKASGKDIKRPQLVALMDYAREGDTILVHSMDRLARNLDDLRRLVQTLTGKGVQVQFIKEGLTFTGEDSAMSQLLLSVMGAFAEFERSLVRERQREGISLAKKKGVYKGRKKSLNTEQVEQLKAKVQAGEGKVTLARELGDQSRNAVSISQSVCLMHSLLGVGHAPLNLQSSRHQKRGEGHGVHGQSRDPTASKAAASHFPNLSVASKPTQRLKDLH